jgi:crossover junction endodeoxyribonuclease RusA
VIPYISDPEAEKAEGLTITLPWMDRRLSPNAKRRLHWSAYRPAIKAARELAWGLATETLSHGSRHALRAAAGKIALTVTFYPPDARLRDDDGMVGAFKHYRDGIADALGLDDHRFRPQYVFADPDKPGRVEVRFG